MAGYFFKDKETHQVIGTGQKLGKGYRYDSEEFTEEMKKVIENYWVEWENVPRNNPNRRGFSLTVGGKETSTPILGTVIKPPADTSSPVCSSNMPPHHSPRR